MAKNGNEIDYSLSYDEYLENFRKTHHPRAIAMSKDQYELMQAREEAQKKREAAREAGTAEGAWAYQKGPSDEIVEKYTGKADPTKEEVRDTANEIIERRITPEQQGIQAKGNPYENKVANKDTIDDTRAIGATKEELDYMLQNGLISKDAYDKQIAALNTPEVQEEMARGEKKADETVWDPTDRDASANNALTDSVSEAVTPKEGDSPTVVSSKNNYNKAMMSIWDAYRAGEIDKETAGYFTIDAIATLAKNLGRSIGNVGAQFSGGTIDNGHDESKWGQRQNALLNETIGKETESLGGAAGRKAESESLDNQAKRIRNAYTPAQLENQIEMFKRDLEMADINLDMAHSKTDLINFIKKDPDYTNSPFKMGLVAYLTQTGAAGAANNASKTLSDALNWIVTLVK